MGNRLSKEEVQSLISPLFKSNEISAQTTNRFWKIESTKRSLLYVSQCKPSNSSKGNWKYEFFHTIKLSTILEILETHGSLLLIDYVRLRYCLLGPADIGWIIRFSSRNKGNEGQVVDIVIKEKFQQSYYLRPYDTHRKEERQIIIEEFK